MATGTASLNFGAFPGASDASVAVTGQTGISAGSLVEAWLLPAATADHTADEHLVETLNVMAGTIVAGTGFTIYGINTGNLMEPLRSLRDLPGGGGDATQGGRGTRLYGIWNVAWAWV